MRLTRLIVAVLIFAAVIATVFPWYGVLKRGQQEFVSGFTARGGSIEGTNRILEGIGVPDPDQAEDAFELVMIITVSGTCVILSMLLSGIIHGTEWRSLRKAKDDTIRAQRLYINALCNADTMLFDYDTQSGRIVLCKDFSERHGLPEVLVIRESIAQQVRRFFIGICKRAGLLSKAILGESLVTVAAALKRLEVVHEGKERAFALTLKEMSDAKGVSAQEFCALDTSGNVHWYSITATYTFDGKGRLSRGLAVVLDVTKRKEREALLIKNAEKDALTGLFNKIGGSARIIDLLEQERGAVHALFILDLDNFKKINDTLGHAAGDKAIIDAANTLSVLFRRSDILCRFGGDEFVVFAPNITDISFVTDKANEVCSAMHRRYGDGGHGINISASVGIALFPDHGRSYEELFGSADGALYVVKERSKDSYALFDEVG